MYCINVKEQFDVRFMIKALIFSCQGLNMFQARSVLGLHTILYECQLYALIFLDNFLLCSRNWSYSLYRKKMISAFKLNEKSLGPGACFPGKKQ